MQKIGILILLTWAFCHNAQAYVTYYEIDFEAPTHTAGNPPAVGAGSDRPSSIRYGQPVVSSNFYMPSQVLVFNTPQPPIPLQQSFEQIQLNMGTNEDNYQISFDVEMDNLKGSLYAFTIQVTSGAIPEPAVGLLFVLGLMTLKPLRRKAFSI